MFEGTFFAWHGPYEKYRYSIYPEYSDTLPRGYKTFFMLNSAEHEIFHANLKLVTTAFAKHSWAWKFLC